MSQERFGDTTRRAFLGTATVATAASLTAPGGAGEAQGVGTGNPAGPTKLAQADADIPGTADVHALKRATGQSRRLWQSRKEGYFTLEQRTIRTQFSQRLRPTMASRLLLQDQKPGREQTIRAYGKTIENAIDANPSASRPAQTSLPEMGPL